MPVSYVKLEISLHGMNAESVEKVKEEVKEALREIPSSSTDFDNDIEVELIESAGSYE